jgi:hypothetical protein
MILVGSDERVLVNGVVEPNSLNRNQNESDSWIVGEVVFKF